jgi:outer membrane lipoprotein-sorting protein
MKKSMLCLSLLIATLLAGCAAPPDRHQEAEKMANQLYSDLQHKNWDAVMDMYGKQFYKGVSKEKWRAHLQSVQQRLGDIQSYSQTFQQRQSKYYSSDVYIIGFSVIYKHGESEDTLTLYQPPGNKRMFIAGHRIVEHPGVK